MDLFTHICSGVAAATVVIPFANRKAAKSLKILGFGALGGAFPDIDAISMWSRFDATIGRLFGLSHTGREIYGAKFWYSHHAFFHSIAAALLISVLLILAGYAFMRIRKIGMDVYFRRNLFPVVAFIAGYLFHLLGDMPTPASTWGGINMFWPGDAYFGGSGKIWWWNNYDIFLLLILCIVVNCIMIRFYKRYARQITFCVALLTFFVITIQVNTRYYDYAYSGNAKNYAEMEQQSKQEQERILSKHIYKHMKWLDDHLPLHF